jgi:hypothetical protein
MNHEQQFSQKMTPVQEFNAVNWPMLPYDGIPGGWVEDEDFTQDVVTDRDGVPLQHCDFRPYVNRESGTITDHRIQMNIRGADNMARFTSEEYLLYTDLETNKELLDHITWEIRTGDGEFTTDDLVATQEAIHQNLAVNKTHPGYKSVCVAGLPKSYFNGNLELGGVTRKYLNYLRNHYHVWYICHQEEHNRIVIMGGNYEQVNNCLIRLQRKLHGVSAGGYINYDKRSTNRYKTALDNYYYDMRNSNKESQKEGMSEEDFRDMVQQTLEDEQRVVDYVLSAE